MLTQTDLLFMANLRAKVMRGEELTLEETRKVIDMKRADRAGVTQAKAGSKASKAKPVVNSDDLLDAFGAT